MGSRLNGRDSYPQDSKLNIRSSSPRDISSRDSAKSKSKNGLNGLNYGGGTPMKASPVNGGGTKSRMSVTSASGAASAAVGHSNQDVSAEKVLCDLLFGAQAVILKSRAHESSHEFERVLFYVNDRAKEIVEYELSAMISNLVELMGANPKHRMTAYSKIGESLLAQMETMILSNDTQRLKRLEEDHSAIREHSDTMYRELSQVIASKDLEIAKYKEQQLLIDEKLKSMSQTNTSLQLEIEKLLRDRIQTHQNSVELRMQGLDFKAEVDRRCGSILGCVQSRMGFVPTSIEKQVELLKALKAPGDPSYDTSRHFKAMRQPSEAPRGSSPPGPAAAAASGGGGGGMVGINNSAAHPSPSWVFSSPAAKDDELMLGEEALEGVETINERASHRRPVSSLTPSSPIQGRSRSSRQKTGSSASDRYENPFYSEGGGAIDRRLEGASSGREWGQQSVADRVAARRPQSAPGNRVVANSGSSNNANNVSPSSAHAASAPLISKSPRHASPTPMSPAAAAAPAPTGDSAELAKRIMSRNAGFVDISSSPHSNSTRISPSRTQSAAGRYTDTREVRSNSDSTHRSISTSSSSH